MKSQTTLDLDKVRSLLNRLSATAPTITSIEPVEPKSSKSAWADWTTAMMAAHKQEVEAYISERISAARAGTLCYTADQAAVKQGRAKAGEAITEKVAKVGAHLSWLKEYKAANDAEWLAFKADWDAKHPRAQKVTEATEATEATEVTEAKPEGKKRGPKSYATMSPEEAAIAKAKRATKKAEKVTVQASTSAADGMWAWA
jgi:hypothetical protein